MEGEPNPPVLVKVTQYAFVLFALANAWLMIEVTSMPGYRDYLTGRLILLNVFLFAISVFQIGNRSKYTRLFTIAACVLMIFRAVRRIYFFHQADDEDVMFIEVVYVFVIFLLLNIMLFLSIAGYFAFSPKVIHYFHPDREAKLTDQPPPPSFET